jgi:hypothetical protein
MPLLRNIPLDVDAVVCESKTDYLLWQQGTDFSARRQREQQLFEELLASPEPYLLTPGFCAFCQKTGYFLLDGISGNLDSNGNLIEPNWRERLICSRCNLNNRNRFLWCFLTEYTTDRPVWFADQGPAMLRPLQSRFADLRFWDSAATKKGSNAKQLGDYPANTFRLQFSLELLNQEADLTGYLTQTYRTLDQEGRFIATFPFDRDQQSTVINNTGTKIIGWDILDQCKQAGFSNAQFVFGWSDKYMQLGPEQFYLYATK